MKCIDVTAPNSSKSLEVVNTASYPKTFGENHFEKQTDGRWAATIFAASHGLGNAYSVTKVIRRKSDGSWENVIPNYDILSNGDFMLYFDEPATCKVYLMGD